MKKTLFLLFVFALQANLHAWRYFPEGTIWTEIRLDTLKYDSWYSKVGNEWVPNYETIEYRVQGEYIDERFNDKYSCIYTNGPEWADSLTLLIYGGRNQDADWYGGIAVAAFDDNGQLSWPCHGQMYPLSWEVGAIMRSLSINMAGITGFGDWMWDVYGTVEEVKEGDFGGVRPLKYSDVSGIRFIQGIGVASWNDGECIFGAIKPYQILSDLGAVESEERHYRSMLVHFERDGEVLYDVWPRKESSVEVAIDGLNYYLDFNKHEAIIDRDNTWSGELDIPSEVIYEGQRFVVKSMIWCAFANCPELTRARIPKTIESVTHHVLNGMNGAVSPDGMNPFMGCTALESVEVDEENPSFKSVDGVLFSQDGKGQYYIGPDYFNGTGLFCYPAGKRQESYIIPEGVEWIGATAFEYSQHLTTLTIPSTMICIYGSAFKGCSNLTDVYCNAETVPITNKQAFTDCPLASATLHVPAGSVEKYKTTSPWSEFGNIVAMPEEPARPLPFLEGNPIWVFKYEPMRRAAYWANGYWDECFLDAGNQYYTYYFLGEKKEIEGKVYTMMGEVGCDREGKITFNRRLPLREENGIVYAVTDSLPGLIEFDYLEPPYLQQGNECVLYDFNKKIGETLYPKNEAFKVGSYGTYQLMDGTVCRVLKTCYDKDLDLYEKLGFLHGAMIYGVMDPPTEIVSHLGGNVSPKHLNAYYQDDVMLYKAPDPQEGLCVNDTCWTRNEAVAYATSYKADPYHEEVMAYIRQLQTAEAPVTFTKDLMATIILPTEPDASKGKYYRLDRVEDGKIIFEQELQPQARVPYIIVPSEDFSIDPGTLDLEGLTQDVASIEGISFIGMYSREEFEEPEGYYVEIIDITPDCSITTSAETGKDAVLIGALRAYLIVSWEDPVSQGGDRTPKEKMEIMLKDHGTGVGDAQRLNDKGQMINDKWYDLQGRQISEKQAHGIFIEDKKKVFKK